VLLDKLWERAKLLLTMLVFLFLLAIVIIVVAFGNWLVLGNMPSGLGVLLLLAIAIAVRFVGNKLIPIAMPTGRLRIIGVGLLGGLVGSLLFQVGPWVVGVNLVGAILGAALFILLVGLFPFVKILLGRG